MKLYLTCYLAKGRQHTEIAGNRGKSYRVMGNIAYTTDTAFYYNGIISGNKVNSLRRNLFPQWVYRLSYYTAYFSTGVFRNSNLRVIAVLYYILQTNGDIYILRRILFWVDFTVNNFIRRFIFRLYRYRYIISTGYFTNDYGYGKVLRRFLILVSIYDNTLTNFANTVQNESFGRYFISLITFLLFATDFHTNLL